MRAALVAAAAGVAAVNAQYPAYPLEGVVTQARAYAAATKLTQPSGLTKADYLPTIYKIVNYFRQFQNAEGAIIDQYRLMETQYATPCFANACATAYTNGMDDTLLPNCTAALSKAIQELVTNTCADGHDVFFVKPVMFAYRQLAPVVDSTLKAQWDAGLASIDPWTDFKWPTNNWGLVGAVGEFMRTQVGGFSSNYTWWQDMMDFQMTGEGSGTGYIFTPNGLYQDHSGMDGLNPLPYDTFPSSGYLTVALAEGYNGTWAPFMREMMRRAALTHALMQSPHGEIPTGGRSSQHQWNSAVSALAYEVWSNWALEAGDTQGACMFKRAAHLAHGALKKWQHNVTGELQIVANWVNASERWGYEVYSYQSQYNLLPASMLAAAWHYASDATEALGECATFADAGGFAFQLPEHRVVVANAGGVYAQLELGSDPHYDSTGLHRVHVNTCSTTAVPSANCVALHTLAGPTAGPPQENGGLGVGPWWATTSTPAGQRVSLANQTYRDVAGVVLTPGWGTNASAVSFSVQYFLTTPNSGSDAGAIVTQDYTLRASDPTPVPGGGGSGGPTITQVSSVQLLGNGSSSAQLTRFGVSFPALLWDGRSNTTVALANSTNSAVLSGPVAQGWTGVQRFAVLSAPGHTVNWTFNPATDAVVCRNGMMAPVWAETSFDTATPSLTVVLAPTAA